MIVVDWIGCKGLADVFKARGLKGLWVAHQ